MIEKVARAMHEAVLPEVPWEPNGDGYYEAQYISARAAIEAMCDAEPTDRMMSAMWSLSYSNTKESFATCWRAMIDAALKEKA